MEKQALDIVVRDIITNVIILFRETLDEEIGLDNVTKYNILIFLLLLGYTQLEGVDIAKDCGMTENPAIQMYIGVGPVLLENGKTIEHSWVHFGGYVVDLTEDSLEGAEKYNRELLNSSAYIETKLQRDLKTHEVDYSLDSVPFSDTTNLFEFSLSLPIETKGGYMNIMLYALDLFRRFYSEFDLD